jgi:glycine dehydrogenase subunit 2
MFEPTETESRETLDEAIAVMRALYQEAHENGEEMHPAPHHAQIKRPDEVLAARQPVLHYQWPEAEV